MTADPEAPTISQADWEYFTRLQAEQDTRNNAIAAEQQAFYDSLPALQYGYSPITTKAPE